MIAANSPSLPVASQSPTNESVRGTPFTQNPFGGKRHLKISECAKFLDVSPSQCRLLASRNELATVSTIGGHRRFLTQSVLAYAYGNLGDASTPETENGNGQTSGVVRRKVIGMCRVSSRKQATKNSSSDKSSLDFQEERIKSYLLSQEKNGGDAVDDLDLTFVHSIGSGLSYERPELLKLVRMMVSGELRGCRLILTTKDRLVRFGWELMTFLANYGGVTIEYCCADEEQTENESLTEDVLSVLTHFTAKASGNKARKILKVILDPESLATAYRMKKAGRSYRFIQDHFKSHNVTSEKGQTYSATIIRKTLNEQWKNLQGVVTI